MEAQAIKTLEDGTVVVVKSITTIDGSTHRIDECVKLGNNYYIKNVQAVLIENRWVPSNSSSIFFDHETKAHRKKMRGMVIIKGIVGVGENGEFIYGEFTPNKFNNCSVWHVKDGEKRKDKCINSGIVKNLGFVEHINDAIWATEDFFGENVFKEDEIAGVSKLVRRNLMNLYSCSKKDFVSPKEYKFENNAYNSEESDMFPKAMKMYEQFKVDFTKDVKRVARMMGDTTFGCEIEVKLGRLPEHLMNQMGVIICKDGSINYTPEFVTVPLQGAKGLQTLQNLFVELNKRCTTDHSCSLHYHFGTIRKDREFLVALYKLYCNIQKDLHKMLPYYKTDPRGIKKDDKNYCQFLDPALVNRYIGDIPAGKYKECINAAAKAIQTMELEGTSPCRDFNRNNKHHPKGGNKWSFASRYASMNLLNMYVSNRQTVEFRAHHAILSPTKALNWFFICAAIIKYAEANSGAIILNKEGYSLDTIINYYKDTHKTSFATNMSNYLNVYVEDRQKYFSSFTEAGDFIVKKDYIDKNYLFEFNGMKDVF